MLEHTIWNASSSVFHLCVCTMLRPTASQIQCMVTALPKADVRDMASSRDAENVMPQQYDEGKFSELKIASGTNDTLRLSKLGAQRGSTSATLSIVGDARRK